MFSTASLALIKTRRVLPMGLRRARRAHPIPLKRRCNRTLSAPGPTQQTHLRVRKAIAATFHLPRTLAYPAPRARITKEAIAVADPSLADVPPAYVRDKLASLGTQMLRAIAHTHAHVPHGTLPTTLPVSFSGGEAEAGFRPTHILAVHALGSTQVALFPAHNVVLAAHCARLPPVPALAPLAAALPVLPLVLPAPAAFPLLQHYLYTHDTRALLSALLPALSAPTCTDVLRSAALVNALWRNVIALGVEDEGVWQVMNAAWASVILGMARVGA